MRENSWVQRQNQLFPSSQLEMWPVCGVNNVSNVHLKTNTAVCVSVCVCDRDNKPVLRAIV